MQHMLDYNLIQGAIGCSGTSPFGVAKSGMKRGYMRNTGVSRRNAQGALGALPHPSMLCIEGPSTLAILFTEDPTALQYWSEL